MTTITIRPKATPNIIANSRSNERLCSTGPSWAAVVASELSILSETELPVACVLFGMLDVVAGVVVNDGDSVSVTVVACVATVVPIVVSALLGCVVGLNVVAGGGA